MHGKTMSRKSERTGGVSRCPTVKSITTLRSKKNRLTLLNKTWIRDFAMPVFTDKRKWLLSEKAEAAWDHTVRECWVSWTWFGRNNTVNTCLIVHEFMDTIRQSVCTWIILIGHNNKTVLWFSCCCCFKPFQARWHANFLSANDAGLSSTTWL